MKLNLWLNLDYAPMTKIKKAEILTWWGKNTQSSISVTYGLKQSRREPSGFSVSQQNGLTFCFFIFSTHGGSWPDKNWAPSPPPQHTPFKKCSFTLSLCHQNNDLSSALTPHNFTMIFDNKHEKKRKKSVNYDDVNQPAVQVSYGRKKPLKTCWELAWMQKWMLIVMNRINIKWKNIPDCEASERKIFFVKVLLFAGGRRKWNC